MFQSVRACLALACLSGGVVACSSDTHRATVDERAGETSRAVDRLLAAPPVVAAPGFTASLLVKPGLMYDPLTIIPRPDGALINDDGREEGEQGGRIYHVSLDGQVRVAVDTSRLYPPTGFDVAPAGFGASGGQFFTVSQPRATTFGTRENHVILRVDPAATGKAERVCTLPSHGEEAEGVPGGGLDARFGPPGSGFANRLFAVTIFNATIYQVSADGVCSPFVTLAGQRPFGIAFTPDGTRMLVATGVLSSPTPVGGVPPPPKGNIVSIDPDGHVDPEPVARDVPRPWGLAVAPPSFAPYAGQVFFTGAGPMRPVGAASGSGALYRLEGGKATVVAQGFFMPTGVAFVGDALWVADIKGDFIPGQQLPDGTIVRIARQ